MKTKTVIVLLMFVSFLSCDEDDMLSESRPLIEFNLQFINNNFDVCRTLDITFLVEEEDVQTSYSVPNGNIREIDIILRKGEFISITAFDTDDTTNTALAFANIDSQFYNETEVNRLTVYYTECTAIDKILWVPR